MTRKSSDEWITHKILQLSPESAQGVIEQGEKAQIRWSPAVMKAFLEQAGKPPQALPEPVTAYEVEDAEDAAEIQEPPEPTPEDIPF